MELNKTLKRPRTTEQAKKDWTLKQTDKQTQLITVQLAIFEG